jgi:hypothetical protein
MSCRQLLEDADFDDANNPAYTAKMKVVCQHCGKHYKDKPCLPEDIVDGDISHGTCPDCHMREMEKIRLQLQQIYGRDVQLPARAA